MTRPWLQPTPAAPHDRIAVSLSDGGGVKVTVGRRDLPLTVAATVLDWPTARSLASWLLGQAAEHEPRPDPGQEQGRCGQCDSDGLHETACPDCGADVVTCCEHCDVDESAARSWDDSEVRDAVAADWERAR